VLTGASSHGSSRHGAVDPLQQGARTGCQHMVECQVENREHTPPCANEQRPAVATLPETAVDGAGTARLRARVFSRRANEAGDWIRRSEYPKTGCFLSGREACSVSTEPATSTSRVGIVIACMTVVLYMLGLADYPDAKLLDLGFWLRGVVRPRPDIVTIAIDEASIGPDESRAPISRDLLARVVTSAATRRPAAILLDVLLDEEGRDVDADARLASAIEDAGNVVLPVVLAQAPQQAPKAVGPIAAFADVAMAVGHVVLTESTQDGVLRRIAVGPLHDAPAEFPDRSFAELGAAPLRPVAQTDMPAPDPLIGRMVVVDFVGPADTFRHVCARALTSGDQPNIPIGAVVIIGSLLPESGDVFYGPFRDRDGSRLISGLEVVANCVHSLSRDVPIRTVSSRWVTLAMLVAAAVALMALPRVGPAAAISLTIAGSLALVIATPVAFVALRTYWQGTGPATALLLVGAAVGVERYLADAARAARIRSLFARYLSREVVDDIVQSGEVPSLLGRAQEVAVLFCDMHGFSAISRQMPPRELVAMLSVFFEFMCGPVLRHGGFVDKFVGDQIMAVFGVPCGHGDDAARAADAAVEMRRCLLDFNNRALQAGWPAVSVAMGINYGQVIAGDVGWEGRTDYTVMGETVVLAQRLQVACERFGTDLLISEQMAREIAATHEIVAVGETVPSGWEEPVRVFTLPQTDGGKPNA